MSVWTTLEGTVQIPKSNHVSINKVVKEFFIDDYTLVVENLPDTYIKNVECRSYSIVSLDLCMYGEEFEKVRKNFLDKLQALSYDLTATLRYLK